MKHAPEFILIRQAAALGMAFSAIEVFPKECMGGLLAKHGKNPIIVASIPYQLAKRTQDAVETYSSLKLSEMKLGRLFKLGDYHSHPFCGTKNSEPLEPSDYDLKDAKEGDIDCIIRVIKTGRRNHRGLRGCGTSISMAEATFRILMKAFWRGKDSYWEVPLRLCDT